MLSLALVSISVSRRLCSSDFISPYMIQLSFYLLPLFEHLDTLGCVSITFAKTHAFNFAHYYVISFISCN